MVSYWWGIFHIQTQEYRIFKVWSMAEQTPQEMTQIETPQSNQSISQIIVQAEFDEIGRAHV